MKYGKDRTSTQNNIVISVDKNGIGEEFRTSQPPSYLQPPQIQQEPTEEDKIAKLVKDKIHNVQEEENKPIRAGIKLYLNRIINLLFNNSKKKTVAKTYRPGIRQTLLIKFTKWWRKESTESIIDLVMFVGLHGLLGAPALVALLTVFNVPIALVEYIRANALLSIITYIVGAGSGYYLLLDINKELFETWGSLKVKVRQK